MQIKTGNNNYSLSTLLTFVGGAGLAIALLLLNYFSLPPMGAQWLFDLIMAYQTFALVGGLVSGNGYFFQWIDRLTKETTLWNRLRHRHYDGTVKSHLKAELSTFIGLSLGLIAGIGIISYTIAKRVPIVNSFVSAMGAVINVIRSISTYGGLGNRVGQMIDNYKRGLFKKDAQNPTYTFGISAGLLIGVLLTALIVIHSGGVALPLVIFSCVAAFSTSASAMGYLGRVGDFMLGHSNIASLKKAANHERVLTTVGMVVGLTVGIILVAAGAATLPIFGLGSFKLTAGILLIGTCISAFSGLGNRVGFLLDRCKPKPVPVVEPAAEEVKDQTDERRQSKGRKRDADQAGYEPESTPTNTETTNPSTGAIQQPENQEKSQRSTTDMLNAMATPRPTPNTPPRPANIDDSSKNNIKISRVLAPKALLTPISTFRSATMSNCTFIKPMPPTNSETDAMRAKRAV
jgi:hypothetical protein